MAAVTTPSDAGEEKGGFEGASTLLKEHRSDEKRNDQVVLRRGAEATVMCSMAFT
jgi:hypothetical protein